MDGPTTVLVVIGTRPEAVKMAPVILALRHRGIKHQILMTGQHRGTVADILDWFGIPEIDRVRLFAKQSKHLPLSAAGIMAEFTEYVLPDSRPTPKLMLVQGDTTSAWAGSVAAYLANMPVMHIEAGLRTGNRDCPFPEEYYRECITRGASYHCASTRLSAINLISERVPASTITITGNTIVDATQYTRSKALEENPTIGLRYLLCTMHRRESFGEPMRHICGQLRELVNMHADIALILPMHTNPAVRDEVMLLSHERIKLVEPMAYPEFVSTLACSTMVLTDSGGVQEEAACLGVPCVVMRDHTDRPESVDSGNSILAGTDRVYSTAASLLSDEGRLEQMRSAENPFGDGQAGQKIADWVQEILACAS